jgi:hypothetical protein
MVSRCFVLLTCISLCGSAAPAQQLPSYLRDRGNSIATSMFGSYVAPGELLVYPFFEYTTQDLEYKPAEMGYGLDQDFFGAYRETETQLFLAYGVTNRVAFELEGAFNTTATLRKARADTSALPSRLRESGVGDIQAELRWRWALESASRPELFTYLETDFPFQRHRQLIGTQEWELKLGTGVTRGLRFGTITARAAVEYHPESGTVEFGEYAVEVLKRLSPAWRVYGGVEGTQDEVEVITEAQWRLGPRSVLKINNAFGLTAKAPRWAPEIGLLLSF